MTTYMSIEMRRLVYERARGCCEYCLLPEHANYLAHEADHIRSVKHGGQTILINLCLSCFDCNRYKGSDIGSFDPETDQFALLYNPRTMQWADHFKLNGAEIVPLTPEGRVTVFLLRLNSHARLIKRTGLMVVGHYPCS